MKFDWARTARRELRGALTAMLEVNPEAAMKWLADVETMIEMLENHPLIGHRHRAASEGEFREVIVGRYRFIYRVAPGVLKMRRILHVRRDYDPTTIRDGYPAGWPAFASA